MTATDNVRNKLAQRAQQQPGQEVEQAQPEAPTAAVLIRRAVERQSVAFKAVLPKLVDPDRFSRLVLTAIKSTPDLMKCFDSTQGEVSVLLSAMQAAAVGLEPNTPMQDCWLLPRKRQGVWECQLSIGYRGYLKLARRSGTIKTIFAEVVREQDHFRWERGLEADLLEHRPYEGEGDAGPLTHAYAVARYTNGGYSFRVLTRTKVEQHRAMSDSWKNERARPYSPWTKWPEEMWRKTAIRVLVPDLDLSADAQRTFVADEGRLEFNDDAGVIDVAAGALELGPGTEDTQHDEQAPDDEGRPFADPETGEVVG